MKRTTKEGSEEIRGRKANEARKSTADKRKMTDEDPASGNTDILTEMEAQNEDESFEQIYEDTMDSEDAQDAVRAVDKELSDIKDRYMRLLAEYDNFRRRTQREREGLYSDAVADVSKEWLLVLDNVERAMLFNGITTDETTDKMSEGLAMIYKQAGEVLAKLGVVEIPSDAGTPFDPKLHAAVSHIEDDSLGEQCIAQVFLKGYRKGDRVIRHSLVQVAN